MAIKTRKYLKSRFIKDRHPDEQDYIDLIDSAYIKSDDPSSDSVIAEASVTTKGITKLSVAPVAATNPVAVGTNDPRMSNSRHPLVHTHVIGDVDNIEFLIDNKVDKVINKGLSTNDYTNADKQKLTDLYSEGFPLGHQHEISDVVDLTFELYNKVDKISGKGLSAENFTAEEKYKLEHLSLDNDLSNYVPITTSINGKELSTDIILTKADIGLPLVDDTSDLDKPISTLTQAAINNIIIEAASEIEEIAAFAAGSKIVIRTDLL
jgi:hypothetical protein